MGRERHGPPPGEVHVRVVREPSDAGELQRCVALLTDEERERRRHLVPSQRALYAAAHAALRTTTAAFSGRPVGQVAFRRGASGKPYVAGDPGLRVSLSHTDGLALVAVSRDGPVGVDVERLVRPVDPRGLRRQVLSDQEAALWPAERDGPLCEGLLTHWTCKEAVLKALGTGLAGDPTAVRVTPGARRSGPVRLQHAPGPPRRWRLHLLDVGPGYRAAVAVAGGGDVVRLLP
ncbi:4'-phosphopantetheinyl transferase superfamily protein [Streptomyces longwoodensis]|uniref:4'-phosphopantetheinyl transferase family protein n=1 Tax=Streptomyces longwoodensis TaxID=68231 RepID=UPI0030E2F2AC|nr:4'-phosphopantetheinyl transferase superfamily protein [Streptomyces longwoodensis]